MQLASEAFVPVVGDDWYQRRRLDAEGEFFRAVSDQGPRRHEGAGGPTRQGLYLLTASGELLGYRNHHDPKVMLRVIQEALASWRALPAAARAPGAVDVPALASAELDARYHREPPRGGLVLRAHSRVLERDGEGGYTTCSTLPTGARGLRPTQDHVWIRSQEWRALVPALDARVGDRIALPSTLTRRLCRFHLVDATRGEPPFWGPGEVRARWSLTVSAIEGDAVTLALSANFDLGGEARGFEGALRGRLVFSRGQGRFSAVELVGLGVHWGEGRWTPGARPGRTPLGFVFELIDAEVPTNRVPPQAGRDLEGYYQAR